MEMSMRYRILFVAGAVIAVAQIARADSPGVTAVLDSSETVLGQPVQLEIQITGAPDAEAPEEIPADGLEVDRTGSSQRIELISQKRSSRVTHATWYLQ